MPNSIRESDPAAPADILASLPCGVARFADDGKISYVNEGLCALLGYSREELVGRHVEMLLTVAGRIFFQTHLFPLVRLHGRAEELFVLLRRKDGSDVGALLNASRRQLDGGAAIDCVVMEVRERRKYEDALLRAKQRAEAATQALELRTRELDEANHAKSQFLAVMSHELRTPLNAIGGYVQLIELGIHGPVTDGQRESLERIGRAQRHLLRLINDVLNLSRMEAGRVEYVREDIALGSLVDEVMPMLEPQLASAGLSATADLPADLVARADREKVQQILINLLTNAVKFTPPGGRITIRGRREGNFIEIAVADTGIGIPHDKLGSIFEPFVQVQTDHSNRREGSGLGLAISRDLARGMRGDLTATSEPGQGSTFILRLPVA